MREISKRKRRNERVEREETRGITNSCKSLECLEKGALITKRGRINCIDLQTQTKKQIVL
jgi:hypothetical protein